MSERKRIPGTGVGDLVVGRIGQNGIPDTDMITAAWTDYLNGAWTRDAPDRPGLFAVANEDGKVCGEALFGFDCSGEIASVTHPNWDGWFYNKPLPRIPARPPKKVGDSRPLSKKVPHLRLV
jgi:hypothetical protein